MVLHVEDNEAQRQTLKDILEESGFAVLQANTAEEALQLCRDTAISLVLADHMFSGSSGTELARHIKAIKPNVPVILHSGSAPTSMRHLDAFVHKGEPVPALIKFLTELSNRFWE